MMQSILPVKLLRSKIIPPGFIPETVEGILQFLIAGEKLLWMREPSFCFVIDKKSLHNTYNSFI